MKTIGILCEHYKLDMFRKLLTKEGLTDTEESQSGILTVIKVKVKASEFDAKQKEVHQICNIVENHYKFNSIN